MPMHFLGLVGHPRHYSELTGFEFLKPLTGVHDFISHAAFLTAAIRLVFLLNVFWSMFKGRKASENPWEASTPEWTVPSPPPHDNFAGKHPVVHHGPYEFSVPGAEKDYIMQDSAPKVTAGH